MPSWYDQAWARRRALAIPAPAAPQANIPLPIRLQGEWLAEARKDGRDVLFTAADGVTKLPHEILEWQSALDLEGIYIRSCHPHTLHHEGKTYVAWIGRDNNAWMGIWDHADGSWTKVAVFEQVNDGQAYNDHDAPTFLRLNDGRFAFFVAKHNDNKLRYRLSTAPDDATAWGPAVQINLDQCTYPKPCQFSNGHVYVFYRRARQQVDPALTRDQTYIRTTNIDGGAASWSAPVPTVSNPGQRPYFSIAKDPAADRVHFLIVPVNAGEAPATESHVMHGYAEPVAGDRIEVFTSDGTSLGIPAASGRINAQSFTKIHDAAVDGTRGYNMDIMVDGAGRPRVTYQLVLGNDPGQIFNHAGRWTGSAWLTAQLTTLPTASYWAPPNDRNPPGASIDRVDHDVVYSSRMDRGVFKVYRHETADGGSTYDETEVEHADRGDCIRPTAIEGNPPADFRYVYLQGPTNFFANLDGVDQFWTAIQAPAPYRAEGRLTAWVKVPELAAGTQIFAYYGNPAASAQDAPADVWDEDYIRVIHGLDVPNRDPSINNGPSVGESTGLGSPEKFGIDSPNSPHQVRDAYGWPAIRQYAHSFGPQDVGHVDDTQLDLRDLPQLTVEFIGMSYLNHVNNHVMLSNFNNTTAARFFASFVPASDGSNPLTVRWSVRTLNGTPNLYLGPIAARTYQRLAFTYDSVEGLRGRLNGALSGTVVPPAGPMHNTLSASPLRLGGTPHSPVWVARGDVGMVRISKVRRPDAWLAAQDAALADPASYWTLGTVETAGAGGPDPDPEPVWPPTGDVRLGTAYGPTGTEFVGSLTLPGPGQVVEGFAYGANGSEFVGTLVVGAGSGEFPTAEQLALAVWASPQRYLTGFGFGVTVAAYAQGQAPGEQVQLDAAGLWAHPERSLTDKAGFALGPAGLDAIPITAPAGVASTFREVVVQSWRRFFGPARKTATELQTLADDGQTPLTSQPISDDGETEVQGAAS